MAIDFKGGLMAIALLFDVTNGFHDAANAIATVVATRALSLRSALLLAAVANFGGAFLSTRVALTIEAGILNSTALGSHWFGVISAALLGAMAWNLLTWYWGLPSSSSHALIGGLVGAALFQVSPQIIYWQGIIGSVVIPMVVSPLVAIAVGLSFMALVEKWLQWQDIPPEHWQRLQILSGMLMAVAHGANDAQKTMGVMTLALVSWGELSPDAGVPVWVIAACALAIALGTYGGGERIIHTTGEKITSLDPVSGCLANLSAALTVGAASLVGFPVSTTQVVVGAITGAGYRHQGEVNWHVWGQIFMAWVLTFPGAALLAMAISFCLAQL
ncbi:inorganic phosphate transporter (PiT) family [Thermosynechococcus sp. NK55a]|jgi:PiT family inorganic phosphate transporter|uniref:inorganic phosphate transporter n=1 Tax=unclassified Thermosynechococcus TaxID=2622553 RepID=UPI0003D83CF9|nr:MULTISPECIES: inorganic phosphate transporter [unclassified Thermosynechococcus]AHB87467.1 inorganic phosphate transporter (PiT) family [Thermosynechococcus sp. NK55a]RMH65901.1 MAG: inorganic phosphate transporter [Cyanobacteria bacterium J003]HIK22113.1 inorganic phosphate transporter [Thermosynechococcus sp. M3746_W2019_013]